MTSFRQHLHDFRVDGSLFLMLGIHVLTMTISVELQYHEPMFTLLIFIVYGPVLASTILTVSKEMNQYIATEHFIGLPSV